MVDVVKVDGKKYYIHGHGKFFYLSKDKRGALETFPEGYEVAKTKTGKPYIKSI